MRLTHMLIPTLKETPKDAEAKSHIMMLRSGMIRKLASGFYSYLPLGFRVLKKVETIVRDEMDASGAQELLLPAVHPSDIWKKTGRYEVMDEILMKVQKGEREYVLGPTHEEIITELATAYIKSYKDMPVTLYQIQTKFRDEARPRFGVIRSREFIMKDAYSFDKDAEGLDKSYQIMYEAYKRIFDRCGLDYVIVQADPGSMGGNFSHEFMVLVDFGEDKVALCKKCGYAASTEVAACNATQGKKNKDSEKSLEYFDTPNLRTIEELTKALKIEASSFVKTILYQADDAVIACLVRGDHEVCDAKVARFLKASKFTLADDATIKKVTGAGVGFSGPVGFKEKVRIVADHEVANMINFISGANKDDKHVKNICPGRDFTISDVADIHTIVEGDACPECGEAISLQTSLEIGHVFKLGTKYTKAFDGLFLDQKGKQKDIIMGCYGIGVNRILAACIEQNYNEEKGMVWPESIAPFAVSIVTANQNSDSVVAAADSLYANLVKEGLEVLYDDRDDRMGVKLNDAELMGAPVHVIIGDKGLKEGKLEVRNRMSDAKEFIAIDKVTSHILSLLKK
ncbi:proline--tRNA ligase [Candidatus Omnitrophota bacterium]